MRPLLSRPLAFLAIAAIAAVTAGSSGCVTSSGSPELGDASFDFDGTAGFEAGGDDADAAVLGDATVEAAPDAPLPPGDDGGLDATVDAPTDAAGPDATEDARDEAQADAQPDAVAQDASEEAAMEAGFDATSDARPMCVDPTVDCPTPLTVCKPAVCVAGLCSTQNAPAGTPCTDQGGNICAALGYCESSCLDGVQDATETDVDCGGAYCDAQRYTCADGKKCLTGADCRDKVCGNGTCSAPTCTDGVQNGTETDVDCGGPCSPCAALKHCITATDCITGVCDSSYTCQLRTNGQQCYNGPSSCASGHCSTTESPGNPICCSSDCTGTCMTCYGGYPGAVTGTCTSLGAGVAPPSGQCPSAPPCGNDGLCTAAGTCEQYSGNSCGVSERCSAGMYTGPSTCDGTGKCNQVSPVSCGNYACNSNNLVCNTTCAQPQDCASGFTCMNPGPTGTCQ